MNKKALICLGFAFLLAVAVLLKLNALHPLALYGRTIHVVLLLALLLTPMLLAFAIRNEHMRFRRPLMGLITFACVLLACETAARIFPIVTASGLNPGVKFFWPDSVYYPRNQHGFRDREFEEEKPENTYRILCVGDSFTEGAGVSRDETFAAVLQESLKAKFPLDVQVYNIGRSGANTVEEVDRARKLAPLLSPDLIILAYVNNDAETHPVTHKVSNTPQTVRKIQRRLVTRSYLCYRLLLTFTLFPTDHKTGYDVRKSQFSESSLGWAASTKAIEEFATSDETRNIDKFAIVFPFPPGEESFYEQVLAMLDESKIETHGLLPLYRQNSDNLEEFAFSPNDNHPNVRAHRMVGEWLAEKVSKRMESFNKK